MSEAELRAMVRDVLREALAGRKGVPASAAMTGSAPAGSAPAGSVWPTPALLAQPAGTLPAVEPVAIASDGDLAAFVRRLTALLDDPATGAAIRAGRHRFSLAGGRLAPPSPAATPTTTVTLSGTVTEAKIVANATAGTILLAPGAVVTPLARDKAKALGLKLEARR